MAENPLCRGDEGKSLADLMGYRNPDPEYVIRLVDKQGRMPSLFVHPVSNRHVVGSRPSAGKAVRLHKHIAIAYANIALKLPRFFSYYAYVDHVKRDGKIIGTTPIYSHRAG